jgi:DNA helicase-2/ATP-dependent DNA helicase PcrA
VRNILDFPGQFDPPARQVTLDRNYRSTQPILAAANAVIAQARSALQGPLERPDLRRPPRLVTVRDEADQAACVVEQVLARREEGLTLKPRRCCSAPPTTAPASRSS